MKRLLYIAGGLGLLAFTAMLPMTPLRRHSAHADFFNAWDQEELAKLVHNCINAQVECGARRTGAR